MNLQAVLKKKLQSPTSEQQVQTEIGTMLISLRNGHLACNFFGNEDKAKLVFGHWKVNKIVYSNKDIEDHLRYINLKIAEYKDCLKNGVAYYPTQN